jgi:hypothetical protein
LEVTEFAVPVRWLATRDAENAVNEPGLFAVPITACKLRDRRTIEFVTKALGLDSQA